MALEMYLELEGPPTDWAAVKAALVQSGIGNLDAFDSPSLDKRMFFNNSETQIGMTTFEGWEDSHGNWNKGPRPFVSAEGNHGCNFPVGEGLVFRIHNKKYDETVEDIKIFLTRLSQLSPMQFVLSFQGEGVYAIRDKKRGFEWFWDAPR